MSLVPSLAREGDENQSKLTKRVHALKIQGRLLKFAFSHRAVKNSPVQCNSKINELVGGFTVLISAQFKAANHA